MKNNQYSTLISNLKKRIIDHLEKLYSDSDLQLIADDIIEIMQYNEHCAEVMPYQNLWNQADIIAISYGDSIKQQGKPPLKTLHEFLNDCLYDMVSTIHILPFFPYSSDDGFAVSDYTEVNPKLGNWQDILHISKDFAVMADLVINHCSSQHQWFRNFEKNVEPGKDYFIEADPKTDLSQVVRPRTSPLLRPTETSTGIKYVWCTFGHDQIDLDFSNAKVLLEFIRIIKLYLDKGIKIFRLDAIAFLWKQAGTASINLAETHEVIKLLRLLIEHRCSDAILITETNIPNRENLSYFGNANEAHLIYNFALPPLILYTFLAGKSHLLRQWMMAMPPAQNGTTYFNFIASHDGIGLRPIEGILSEKEVNKILKLIKGFGGDVSWRALSDNTEKPYELNISLIDAMKGTFAGEDEYQLQRFISAHAIMLALEGIPAFYIHSLVGTENDLEKKQQTGNKRSINRHNWDYDNLITRLNDRSSLNHKVLTELRKLIKIRRRQRAFHPNATQFTMHFEDSLFGFWRQSQDRSQSIFCIYNVSNKPYELGLKDINLIETDNWRDLISDYHYENPRETINLEPYEFIWISNK